MPKIDRAAECERMNRIFDEIAGKMPEEPRGKKRQSHGVTAHVHSYLCPKSARGRYRHDSHRPCVVLAFQRLCVMLNGTRRRKTAIRPGVFSFRPSS